MLQSSLSFVIFKLHFHKLAGPGDPPITGAGHGFLLLLLALLRGCSLSPHLQAGSSWAAAPRSLLLQLGRFSSSLTAKGHH